MFKWLKRLFGGSTSGRSSRTASPSSRKDVKSPGISPDELAKVLRGEAGVVACPFCGRDNRVTDVQTPFGCSGCAAMFCFLPGEVPRAEMLGKIASNFASLPGFAGLGRIDKVKAAPVQGLARKHFALCIIMR